jgi:hypothetical protein
LQRDTHPIFVSLVQKSSLAFIIKNQVTVASFRQVIAFLLKEIVARVKELGTFIPKLGFIVCESFPLVYILVSQISFKLILHNQPGIPLKEKESSTLLQAVQIEDYFIA